MRAFLLSALVAVAVAPWRRGPWSGVPVKTPAAVGMSAARLAIIDHIVERGIDAGGYPGAAVVVGRRGAAAVERDAAASAGSAPIKPVSPGTARDLHDLASLTKVIATTSAIMVLYDEGKIHLDDPAKKYIPEFSGGNKDKVTIRLLLEHRSGLPPGRNLWRTAHSPAEAREQGDLHQARLPYQTRPGTMSTPISGADMLPGSSSRRPRASDFDRFVTEHVYIPLGMSNTFFRPSESPAPRSRPPRCTLRADTRCVGEVHDENAYALLAA